jgi:hypothetical protein
MTHLDEPQSTHISRDKIMNIKNKKKLQNDYAS